MSQDSAQGIPAAIERALPHLSRERLLEDPSALAHEYVARSSGSSESVLSVSQATFRGAESGYAGAVGNQRPRAEDG